MVDNLNIYNECCEIYWNLSIITDKSLEFSLVFFTIKMNQDL